MAKKRNHSEATRPGSKHSRKAAPREVRGEPFFVRHRHELLVCLTLTIVTAAIYWQVGSHQFLNFDDDVYVYENPMVRAGLSASGVAWAFSTFQAANWHPLTWLSHMLDVSLFGLNAGRHLYTNLVLHILNSLLLFLALRRMTGAVWRSAFVAALFALHPLHIESVAWVAERKDVLSAFFWMLTLLAYAYYVERTASWRRYLLVIAGLALGLLAKPMLVTLPFALLLLDYWPLNRWQWLPADGSKALLVRLLPLLREKIPLFALIAASSVITYFAQHYGGAVKSLMRFPLPLRLSNVAVAYVSYIGKMLWPSELAIYYPYQRALAAGKVAGATLLMLGLTTLALYAARRRGYLLTGWLWYLGILVPVVGFVQVGEQALADRYTYLPLIGLFIIIAWGAADALKTWRRRTEFAVVAAGALSLALCFATWRQLHYWRDNVALYERTLAVTSNNYVIQTNLGYALSTMGRRAEAIEHLRAALRIEPYFFEAHNSLGAALTQERKFDEALEHYEIALRVRPDTAKVHSNIGAALGMMGRFDEAAAHLNEALRLDPDYPNTHFNLGLVLLQQRKPDVAAQRLAEALRLQPDNAEAHNAYGLALMMLGRVAEAIEHFKLALKLKPDYAQAQSNLRNAQAQFNQLPQ